MKVLVTGGSGRIGIRAMKVLEKAGYEVIGFDIKPPKNDYNFIIGDIRDRKSTENVTKNVDVVLHLAAYPNEGAIPSYQEGWDVNCTGTFNIFESAVKNKVKKVVYASSICATGILTWVTPEHSLEYFPVDENHPCRPENLYGTSKLLAEKLAWMYSKRSNTSFIGLRIATVWFDNDAGNPDRSTKWIIENFVKDPSAVFKQPFSNDNRRFALKDLVWQYVGVWDVCEALKLAVEKADVKFRIYNIGASDTCSNWDSVKIAQFFYPNVPIRNPWVFLVERKKALWDISRAKRELGYMPKFSWTEFARK
ncbi:MAG: NAD-dependent epimerase/dehydratase family protein [Candidatus Baldrarchaeia archaeon]